MKRMEEEELKCIEQMVAYFLKKEPDGPYWNILNHLCFEVREQQKVIATCHKRLSRYAKIILSHTPDKKKKKRA